MAEAETKTMTIPMRRSPKPVSLSSTLLTSQVGNEQRLHERASHIFSPVNQKGCFEFDRVLKSGNVLKRTRKTKSWRTVHLVLRPHTLSIYADHDGTKLRHQIQLADLTAVARQRDPRKKAKHVFALFSPKRNYHIEAPSEADAQKWVELIRSEARIEEEEDEAMALMSPVPKDEHTVVNRVIAGSNTAGETSASEVESARQPRQMRKSRSRNRTNGSNVMHSNRKSSLGVHSLSAAEASFSDFSDAERAFSSCQGVESTLSLSLDDVRSGNVHLGHGSQADKDGQELERRRKVNEIYQPSMYSPTCNASINRPGISRHASAFLDRASQHISHSGIGDITSSSERIIYHSHLQFLKSSHLKTWKTIWAVLRPKSLALYRDSNEYQPIRIIDFKDIVDAVETDDLGKSKKHCFQVIAEEKRWRFCASSEEELAGWVGAFKSLVARRREDIRGRGDNTREIERLNQVAEGYGVSGFERRVVSEPLIMNKQR